VSTAGTRCGFAAIIGASVIINLWWVQVLGALYLLFLPIKHFISHSAGAHHKGASGASFWMTVVYADLADLAFAIDSVLVAVAIEPKPEKVWVVYTGAVVGIVLLRYAANAFLKLLERFPVLDHLAYILVGWAGAKLLLLGVHTYEKWFAKANPGTHLPFHVPEMPAWLFWGGLVLIVGIGSWIAFRNPAPKVPDDVEIELIDELHGLPAGDEPAERIAP
jgi:YkoY family integral membrane protein